MIQLSNSGAYLINGTELVYDNADAAAIIAQKTGKNVTEALKQVREEIPMTPEIEYIVSFIENSQRGIIR